MARKSRKSGFENLIETLAVLPWQACLVLAPIAWFGFHVMAKVEPPPITDITQMGANVRGNMIKTAGMFLQVLIPIALTFAALMS